MILPLLIAVAVSATPSDARAWELQQQTAAPMHVESSMVLVEATVKDKAGKLIDGLVADDFRVRDDGKEQTVTYFSRDELPLAVALVVDSSDSIVPYFDQLRASMQAVLGTLKNDDQAALFTFASEVQKRADLTADKSSIAERFKGIRAGGSTNLNDALYEAAHYLRKRAPTLRRVIILVSDNVPSEVGYFSRKWRTKF